jgi:hypothetical protein
VAREAAAIPVKRFRNCEQFVDVIQTDSMLPEWVRHWRGTRSQREFLREDIGVRYCKNASVFDQEEALVILAQDLRLEPRSNSSRLHSLSPAAQSTVGRLGELAERHICPDWRTTKFSLGNYDEGKPLRCGAEILDVSK